MVKIYLIQMLIDNCAWQTERAYDSREKAIAYIFNLQKSRYFRYRIKEMNLR